MYSIFSAFRAARTTDTELTLPTPLLDALVSRARRVAAGPRVALVHPCDALAIRSAYALGQSGVATPILVGPRSGILQAGLEAGVNTDDFECVHTSGAPIESAWRAIALAREGEVSVLMKGSLHTDELMSAVVHRDAGLRMETRISHVSVFELPSYHKLLALTDCGVNIAPDLRVKREIITNALRLLKALGIAHPKVAILAAVETVNPAIPATMDAATLMEMARDGMWPGAIIEGPLGFDNAISAEAAQVKAIKSQVSGDVDLLVVPDLNTGNLLYKSFSYVGGGACAALVVGARVPIVVTSRADSTRARIASVAVAVLAAAAGYGV